MVTETGVIKEIRGDKALVVVQRGSQCSHCSSHGACSTMNKKEMMVEVINDLHARTGDQVEISLPTGSFLKMSLMVYFVPVIALVVGAVVGGELAPSWGYEDPTLVAASLGGAAMVAAFLLANRFDRGLASRSEYWPRITRLLPASPQPCDNK